MANDLQQLPIDQLQPNPFQPREKIKTEEVTELSVSIAEHGILEPLVVAQTPAGYQIVAGERRWRAAKIAGLKEVPVVIRKATPKKMLEMALVENIQRSDLNCIERAQAFAQLRDNFGYSATQVSEQVGKSLSYVSSTLRLLDLPDAITDGLVSGLISEGHAKAILQMPSEELKIKLYKTIVKEGANVRRTEELARHYAEKFGKPTFQTNNTIYQVPADQLKAWRDSLKGHFDRSADIDVSRSQRQTKVVLYLKGTPEQTQGDFLKILKKIGIEN